MNHLSSLKTHPKSFAFFNWFCNEHPCEKYNPDIYLSTYPQLYEITKGTQVELKN